MGRKNSNHLPAAMIPGERYARWLRENPKKVKGAHVQLHQVKGPYGEQVHFESRQFTSKVDGLSGKDLQLFGYTVGFRGFKVYAAVAQKEYREYLIRGDYCHENHPVDADDGKQYPPGTPHFHYLDPANPDRKGRPGHRRKVTPKLAAGRIAIPDFVIHFFDTYYFRDHRGRELTAYLTGESSPPKPTRTKTKRIETFLGEKHNQET